MEQVNSMRAEKFIETFGNVVEHCHLAGAAAWSQRPFVNPESLFREICNFLDQLPPSGQEGILRLYPDLAGRLAQDGGLTSESVNEHKAAELDTLTDEERKTLTSYNEKYMSKFGFPFVICARENKKAAIMCGIKERITNSKEKETKAGIEEVKKIMFYRILDAISKLN